MKNKRVRRIGELPAEAMSHLGKLFQTKQQTQFQPVPSWPFRDVVFLLCLVLLMVIGKYTLNVGGTKWWLGERSGLLGKQLVFPS
jgi:hypothetical protein